ncbi:hypothetical protein [Reyranella sp.]|uniref:hypothetical protein n=1 Tax=Reyranella sp. TaxID=1929291 RepID=UPI003BAD6C3A
MIFDLRRLRPERAFSWGQPPLLTEIGPRFLTISITIAVVAASGLALLLPSTVYSRVMAWDFLFNLSGAWAIQSGLTLHVDVHDPLGALTFWLTILGFYVDGPSVRAFLIGNLVMAGAICAIATVVTCRRLPPIPAAIFVLMVSQLCLAPINAGDLLDDFTFAMSYNVYGWAAITTLALTLLVPAAPRGRSPWIDLVATGVLLLILYYLKITYFLAAAGVFVLAFFVNAEVRAAWRHWAGLALVVLVLAAAPWNWAYLGDIASALDSGAARARAHHLLFMFSANRAEFALWMIVLVAATALWVEGRTSLWIVLGIAAIYIASIAILSQNAQQRSLPLCMVALFMLYRELSAEHNRGIRSLALCLLALLVPPAASILNNTFSIALYAKRAINPIETEIVERTNLKGLAVPIETVPAWQILSGRGGYSTGSTRARSIFGTAPLTQAHYVRTLLEAVSLLGKKKPGGIAILDQINPLPFALGWVPAAGGNLWYDESFPWPPAERVFGQVDYVLVPKFATSLVVLKEAEARYRPYLDRHFTVETESESWSLLTKAR